MKENENVDKHIENLMDKAMRHSALETPSFVFTATIMAQVNVKQSFATTYQPLISRRGWAIIGTGFVAFMAFIVITTKPEASGWFTTIDLNTEKVADFFKGIYLPRTAAYGIGLLAMLLMIQIPILKNYFDKRILS